MARFEVVKERTAVVVVDMQNEFVEPGAAFAVPGAPALAERMGTFIDAVRPLGVPIIFTAYQARPELPPTAVASELFEPARLRTAHVGPPAELYAGLTVRPGDIVVAKRRQSGFYATDLELVLRTLAVDTVVICGLTTNVCCLATARDAAARDFRVILLADLTATFALPAPGGGMVPGETVQAVTCAIVAHSIGEVTSADDLLGRLATASS